MNLKDYSLELLGKFQLDYAQSIFGDGYLRLFKLRAIPLSRGDNR